MQTQLAKNDPELLLYRLEVFVQLFDAAVLEHEDLGRGCAIQRKWSYATVEKAYSALSDFLANREQEEPSGYTKKAFDSRQETPR